jgi:hypothetical protein
MVGTGSCNSTTAAIIYMATPVQMRAAPTVTVSAGTFHAAPAGAAASGTIAAGSTHTVNAITINVSSITATTAGFGTPLVGGGGNGYIVASAADRQPPAPSTASISWASSSRSARSPRKATYRQVTHNPGPGGMAIVARR